MSNPEELFLAECRRLGYEPSADVRREAAIHLAGSTVTAQGLLSIPGKGSISPGDLARSLCTGLSQASEDTNQRKLSLTLTERMRVEIAMKRKSPLPTDWNNVRSRVTGLTAKMMDEIASTKQKGTK